MIPPQNMPGNRLPQKPALPAGSPLLTPTPVTAPPGSPLNSVISHRDIAERAYDLYVQGGYQQGQSLEYWAQAENDLHHQGLLTCHAQHVKHGVFAPDAADDP